LVTVSGRGTQVNFKIDDSVPLETACRALREHLDQGGQLYANGEVAVDVGKRILRDDDQDTIREVIHSHSGLKIKRFWCEPSVLERERERITDLLSVLNPSGNGRVCKTHIHEDNGLISTDLEAGDYSDPFAQAIFVGGLTSGGGRYGVPGLIVRGTCRAGEVIKFDGNVVILGNVNPGAQVIADGDILVFGGLRGLAHAGAEGDMSAIIIAMSTASPNLRIAGYSWRGDDGQLTASRRRSNDGNGAVIARVQNGEIHVAPYLRNHDINHGGNPNER
jgi:septum site-determining protein MinC